MEIKEKLGFVSFGPRDDICSGTARPFDNIDIERTKYCNSLFCAGAGGWWRILLSRGAGASATIQQHRITHDAAMRTPHYLIQENMAHRTKKLIFASATEAYMSGLFKDNSYFDLF